MNYIDTYNYWCKSNYFDDKTKTELLKLTNQKEIEDRFYKHLDFGTGGLRGIVGAGTNRINIYTVRKASQGVADYVRNTSFPKGVEGIAIAYDSRRMSKIFAREAACVFAANGITAHVFNDLMPTPVLSYTVRHLRCALGIVITASHNPKEYNGYKVYGMDGGQITDALALEISNHIKNVEPIDNIKNVEFEVAIDNNLICYINDLVFNSYLYKVLSLSAHISAEAKKKLKVVYTPLHGTGYVPVTCVLAKAGFSNVYVVERQKLPDEEFRTVKIPNPEDHDALKMAISLAKEKDADIVIATDPDSDRLGIAVRDTQGEYVFMNGNQLGCLLLDNCICSRKAQGILTSDDYVVKTIVTTRMADMIAQKNGIRAYNVLTGFKYIGEKIKQVETSGNGEFIFGFEESYGYLSGSFVRDKDAIIAALMTCEVAANCKENRKTLVDLLNDLFEKYGYYLESLKSYTLPGKDGVLKIESFMNSLRNNSLNQLCGSHICVVEDYLSSFRMTEKGREIINLPKSNVLLYELDNGALLVVRPSGTEPKLKIYIGVKGTSSRDCQAQIKAIENEVDKMVIELTA